MRIYKEEFKADALRAINEAAERRLGTGCVESSVDCLMEATYRLFDPVSRLVCAADHCETFTSLPSWRYDLEDAMVERWESFCNSVHFFLNLDCHEKADQEIELLFEWIKNATAKYTALLDSHTNGSAFREPPF